MMANRILVMDALLEPSQDLLFFKVFGGGLRDFCQVKLSVNGYKLYNNKVAYIYENARGRDAHTLLFEKARECLKKSIEGGCDLKRGRCALFVSKRTLAEDLAALFRLVSLKV